MIFGQNQSRRPDRYFQNFHTDKKNIRYIKQISAAVVIFIVSVVPIAIVVVYLLMMVHPSRSDLRSCHRHCLREAFPEKNSTLPMASPSLPSLSGFNPCTRALGLLHVFSFLERTESVQMFLK